MFKQRLTEATGVSGERIDQLLLSRFEGRLSERLAGSSSPWLLVLSKVGYHGTRPSHLYCPACLADDAEPHLSVFWRLAFMLSCPRHGTLLRDVCPHCGAIFAPALNDLGPGRDWRHRGRLPFAWCHACGRDLRVMTEPAPEMEQEFQAKLVGALRTGSMPWDALGKVPAQEGFEVLRQLVNVLFMAGPQKIVSTWIPGPITYPEGPYLMFRDMDLQGRRALLAQVAFLTEDWPTRLLSIARNASLTRKPLVTHLTEVPAWYDMVAAQLRQVNGQHRSPQPLVPHLDLVGIEACLQQATSVEEKRRWTIIQHYAQQPNKQTLATSMGFRRQLVSKVVNAYNLGGPGAVRDPRIGRVDRNRRALSAAQEVELADMLGKYELTTAEVGDWIEERLGRRLDPKTVRRYQRTSKNCETDSIVDM